MAAEGPDPKTFSSWEEAFQQPVPVVRGMEKQLRRDIDANKEKLRTLVGASYRDLLNTAESIIDMNGQMHNVETHMAEIGQKCNTRLLERKDSNFRAWQEAVDRPDGARFSLASQLSVLRSCPDVISRLLKSRGSLLLVAKVLVISRLLHTKLSKRPSPPPYLEILRNRLATLRRRLLTRIDRRFKIVDASKEALIEAMCAFALATSSSPTDVVRHFHHLRLEAVAECMSKGSEKQDSMLQALRLYVKTLRDTQALVPGQLAHALERLKMVSIFKSQDLCGLMELNLDVHEKWIEDDIKTFTPYIRHDDLNRAEAEQLLKQWAELAVSRFLDGLKGRIRDVQDPVRLMQLRKDILELWLSQHQRSLEIDSAETLDGLRDVFNDQAISIIRLRVSALQGVVATVQQIIKDWREGQSKVTLSLWDSSMTSMETTNGAKRFCETITDRLSGTNEPLHRVSHEYAQWLNSIAAIETTTKSLREIKWEDAMDDVDNDDELLDNKQALLSEDDPRLLQDALSEALTEAYTRLESSLQPAHLLPTLHMSGQKTVFVLRLWRDLRKRLPSSYRNPKLGLDVLPKIADAVVKIALEVPLQSCSKRLARSAKIGRLATRPLWEGDPELPLLPSPWAHRLLLEVVQSMTELGGDIWSPHLAEELKTKLAHGLADVLKQSKKSIVSPEEAAVIKINGHANVETNGDSKGDDTQESANDDGNGSDEPAAEKINGTHANGDIDSEAEEEKKARKDRKIQRLFDVLYLTNASMIPSRRKDTGHGSGLGSVQVYLEEELKLDLNVLERLRRDADEYWKRTKLLFALLQ